MNALETDLAQIDEPTPNGSSDKTTTPRSLRARLVAVSVQLEVVADDGTTLFPIQLQPQRLAAAEWTTFDINKALADVQRQITAT